jgi:hypothetical protein
MFPQVTEKSLLIPRLTDMRNGTFRPECVISDEGLGDIVFGAPVATLDEARRLATQLCWETAPRYR